MPDVAVIIPARDAANTIDTTLRSVTRQLGAHSLEIIVIDDGSRDETSAVVDMAAALDSRIRLIRSSPAGPGAARNMGLAAARAQWVTFLDADDVWDPGYLSSVDDLLRASGPVAAVCTAIVRFSGKEGETAPQPPLRSRFAHGALVVDLDEDPGFVIPNVAGVFFRREVIVSNDLRFDPSLRWSEDFDFACRYFLAVDRRRVGVVPRARYYYRVSPGGITASAWEQPDKYVLPFDRVYAPLVSRELRRNGAVPRWLQSVLLYDLFWYLHADRAVLHPSARLPAEVRLTAGRAIHALVREAVEVATIASWNVLPLGYSLRSLLRLMAEGPGVTLSPVTYSTRPLHRLRKVSYFYSGPPPEEQVIVDGRPWNPVHSKHVRHSVFDIHVASERIVWVPAGARVSVVLNERVYKAAPFSGEPRRVAPGQRVPVPRLTRTWRLRRYALARAVVPDAPTILSLARERVPVHRIRRVGRRHNQAPPADRDTPGVWVFHDRDAAADDNAEHLYRHVMREHPGFTIRFLLSARSSDWDRLAREGFALVDADDMDAVAAMWRSANIAFLGDLSSPSYVGAVARGDLTGTGVVFLQHGVTTADQSRWLNPKRIELMVTTTVEEHAAIVADETPYVLTDYEVRRVGMPRHDALSRELAEADGKRDTVLVAPTWSVAAREALYSDEYLTPWEDPSLGSWHEIGADTRLRVALGDLGLTLRYFLHPLLAGYGPRLWDVCDGTLLPAKSQGLQETFARTHTVVTDYSSVGIEAAIAGARGVRYLPSDSRGERRLGLGEMTWPGKWEYAYDRTSLINVLIRSVLVDVPASSPVGVGSRLLDGKACERLLDVLAEDFVLDREHSTEEGK